MSLVSNEDLVTEQLALYLRQMVAVALKCTELSIGPDDDEIAACRDCGQRLMQSLERRFGSSAVVDAMSRSQVKRREAVAARKRKLAEEAVSDPKAYAARKLARTDAKKYAHQKKMEKIGKTKAPQKRRTLASHAVITSDL